MNAKACIFDLDGTLLYTLDAIALAGNRMLGTLGLPAQPADAYRYFCGDGSDNLVRRALLAAGGFTEEHFAEGCILNRQYLAERANEGVHFYDGMEDVLKRLRERGLRLAVCSNKPDEAVRETMKIHGGSFFNLIAGQKAGVPIKPDPTGALAIAESFGVRPEECVYFGDTATDMKTGRAAGMKTVGCLWGYRDREELILGGAEMLIERPEEILRLPYFDTDEG